MRLIGAGLYNLSGSPEERQLSFDDQFSDQPDHDEKARKELLNRLQARYGLDFAANLEKIYHYEVLHKTVEYMRKFRARTSAANFRGV